MRTVRWNEARSIVCPWIVEVLVVTSDRREATRDWEVMSCAVWARERNGRVRAKAARNVARRGKIGGSMATCWGTGDLSGSTGRGTKSARAAKSTRLLCEESPPAAGPPNGLLVSEVGPRGVQRAHTASGYIPIPHTPNRSLFIRDSPSAFLADP